MIALLSLFFGTFASEDLACIAAGLLIQRGELGSAAAIIACAGGIFVGDVGLWAAGRVGARMVFRWPPIARQLGDDRLMQWSAWLERNAAAAIVGSRFLPGTRLPLYVIAGLLRLPGSVFAWWALVGTVLWTPALVLVSAGLGNVVLSRTSPGPGFEWVPGLAAGTAVFLIVRAARALFPLPKGFCLTASASGRSSLTDVT